MTKISIIIPSFNQGQFLEETIKSVLNQNYDNLEIIIIDGGSTDCSVDIIKEYQNQLTYWHSKKDNGQSDAINQGFRIATGEIVTWLNSDDILLPNTLHAVNTYATLRPETQWFLGNVLWIDKEGQILRVGRVEKESSFWNRRHLFSNGGPTAFMRRENLLKIGALREDFHYMMDTELWHRFISLGQEFVRIPDYCWCLRLHENAKMSGHNFENSELAAPTHPSWEKKKKESLYIENHYPIDRKLQKIWYYYRLIGVVGTSKVLDKRLIGKNYQDIL